MSAILAHKYLHEHPLSESNFKVNFLWVFLISDLLIRESLLSSKMNPVLDVIIFTPLELF